MESRFGAIPSRVTAATLLCVWASFWLPYITGNVTAPLVNPIWSLAFGALPSMASLAASSQLVLFVALISPAIVIALLALLLFTISGTANSAIHFSLWISILVIIPLEVAFSWSWFARVAIYRYFAM